MIAIKAVNLPQMWWGIHAPYTLMSLLNIPVITSWTHWILQSTMSVPSPRVSSKQCVLSWCEVIIVTSWPSAFSAQATFTTRRSAPPDEFEWIVVSIQCNYTQPIPKSKCKMVTFIFIFLWCQEKLVSYLRKRCWTLTTIRCFPAVGDCDFSLFSIFFSFHFSTQNPLEQFVDPTSIRT